MVNGGHSEDNDTRSGLWYWLIRPTKHVVRPEERRRIQLYLSLLLGSFILLLLYVIVRRFANHPSAHVELWCLVIGILYILTRSSSPQIGIYLGIGSVLVSPFDFLLVGGSFLSISPIFAALIAVWLAVLLLPPRETLLVIVLNLILKIPLVFFVPDLSFVTISFFVGFDVMLALLALIATNIVRFDGVQHERREADQRETTALLQRVVEFMPQMVAVVRAGEIVYINPAGCKLIGAASSQLLIGRPFKDYILLEDEQTAAASVPGSNAGLTIRTHTQLTRQDGTVCDIHVVAIPTTYRGELATQFYVEDVTQSRKSEQTLRESEARFRTLAENIPTFALIFQNNQIVYVNPPVERYIGLEPVDFARVNLLEFIHPDDREMVMRRAQARLNDESVPTHYEFRIVREGRLYWLSFFARRIMYDNAPAIFGIATDVTPYKNAMQRLELFEATIDQVQDSIILTDANVNNLKVKYANAAFLDLNDCQLDDIIDTPLRLLYGPEIDSSFFEQLKTPLANGQIYSGEMVFHRKDGSAYSIACHAAPLYDENGSVTNYVLIQRALEPAAEEKSERYHLISELMTNYVYALEVAPNDRMYVDWVAGAFHSITGLSPDEIQTPDDFARLIHPEDRSIFNLHRRIILANQPDESEFRIITADGHTRWLRDYSRPVWDEEAGRVVKIYGSIHNVTDRVDAESALKSHALQQAVVAELGQMALVEIESDILLSMAANLVAQVLDVPICAVINYTPDQKVFTVQGVVGWEFIDSDTTAIADDFAEFLQDALTTNQPLIFVGVDNDPRFVAPQQLLQANIVSGVIVVIHGQESAYGLLSIYTRQPRVFTTDDVNFLQSVANVIGTYTERVRVQQAEHEQRLLAEALRDVTAMLTQKYDLVEVFDRILQLVSQVVPSYDAANIMVLDEETMTLDTIALRGYQETAMDVHERPIPIHERSLMLEMIESRQAYIIQDTQKEPRWTAPKNLEWIRSYLGAPILAEDQCIGIINLDSATPGAFTKEDRERMGSFTNQASIAIQNFRHAQQLERHVLERTTELKAEREQLQAILDSSGEGIFYSEGYIIRFTNSVLLQLTGYEADELIGHDPRLLMPNDVEDDELTLLASVIQQVREGDVWRGELRIKRKDGVVFPAGLTVSSIGFMEDGQIRTVVIVRDISTKKQLEEQKARFISYAAHELRSPITTLNTRTYLMRRQPEKLETHIEHVEQVSKRMSRLVEDLLDLSRFEQGRIVLRREDTILQDVIASVYESYIPEAAKKQISLTQDTPLKPLHVYADADRMMQVLVNLVANAINYTPEGGKIDIHLGLNGGNDHAMLKVQDNGIGISAEDLPHVFQPFFRVNDRIRGAGLGLSITKEIIERHDGEISVDSVEGQGSCFTVRLPLLAVQNVENDD